jgi:hypothetical protein
VQCDAFRNEPAQHGNQVPHHVTQVEHDGLHDLLSAEGEELPNEPGRTLDRLAHLLEVIDRSVVVGECADGEFVEAGDGGEDVVEVVCDAASEAAHRIHALGLQELSLESLVGAHVHQHRADADEVPLACAHGEHGGQPFAWWLATLRSGSGQFEVQHGLIRRECARQALLDFGPQAREQIGGPLANDFGRAPTDRGSQSFVDPHVAEVSIMEGETNRCAAEHSIQLRHGLRVLTQRIRQLDALVFDVDRVRLQLLPRVGDGVGHGVERSREYADLVAATVGRAPTVVAAPQAIRGGDQVPDGARHRAGEQRGDERTQQKQRGGEDRQPPGERDNRRDDLAVRKLDGHYPWGTDNWGAASEHTLPVRGDADECRITGTGGGGRRSGSGLAQITPHVTTGVAYREPGLRPDQVRKGP